MIRTAIIELFSIVCLLAFVAGFGAVAYGLTGH